MKKLASYIASLEGKKSQARIGDIYEIIKLVTIANSTGEIPEDAAGEYFEYIKKIDKKVDSFLARGMSPAQVLAKMLGRKR